jgi:acyl carrier protein
MNVEIRDELIRMLRPRMERFGVREHELTSGFDLVKSGFVNSLEFVELVTGIEKRFHLEIDFEKALDSGEFTTFGGVIRAIEKHLNG